MECERKFLFVINPIAGGRKKQEVPEQILHFCKQSSCLYRVYETNGKTDTENIQKICAEIQPDAVVAIGGDGTIHLVGNILINTSTPLGIIPLGSTNGLAKDLGIPLSIPQAFQVLRNFRAKTIDTLKIDHKNCFHISDFGFNARISHRFAASLLRGRISYLWYGLQEFFRYKSFPYEIETPEHHYQGSAFMIVVSNAHKFGSHVTINPLGKIDDGWFEISILKPFSRLMAPYIFYHLVRDQIYKTRYYKVIRCKKAVICNRVHEFFHIDGEPVTLGERIEVLINPSSLRVLLP